MSNYSYESVSPRSQAFNESIFSSPNSFCTESERSVSTHSSYSDDEEPVIRIIAPHSTRPMHGSHNINQEHNALGFSDLGYLNDALKLDPTAVLPATTLRWMSSSTFTRPTSQPPCEGLCTRLLVRPR